MDLYYRFREWSAADRVSLYLTCERRKMCGYFSKKLRFAGKFLERLRTRLHARLKSKSQNAVLAACSKHFSGSHVQLYSSACQSQSPSLTPSLSRLFVYATIFTLAARTVLSIPFLHKILFYNSNRATSQGITEDNQDHVDKHDQDWSATRPRSPRWPPSTAAVLHTFV